MARDKRKNEKNGKNGKKGKKKEGAMTGEEEFKSSVTIKGVGNKRRFLDSL